MPLRQVISLPRAGDRLRPCRHSCFQAVSVGRCRAPDLTQSQLFRSEYPKAAIPLSPIAAGWAAATEDRFGSKPAVLPHAKTAPASSGAPREPDYKVLNADQLAAGISSQGLLIPQGQNPLLDLW